MKVPTFACLLIFLLAVSGAAAQGGASRSPGGTVLHDFEHHEAMQFGPGPAVQLPDGKLMVAAFMGPQSKASLALIMDEVAYGRHALKMKWERGDWVGLSLGPFDDGKTFGQWGAATGISMWVYGERRGNVFAIDFRDQDDEVFRATFVDNFKGWKRIVLPFSAFKQRTGWQPETARLNGKIDWPAKALTLEPLNTSGQIILDLIEVTQG